MMKNDVEVSVVMPCLNEEDGIAICIKKIKEVFEKEGISGEIVVADNGSVDRSKEVASSLGAKVVIEVEKGYGAACLRGLRETQGKYIIMGDGDNTYDFYDIPKFLDALRNGYDFVMGSRFKGEIKKGAMPWVNRFIGNPTLSFMTRLFFRTNLSDIHCGMRAFTARAYKKMKLCTIGMEFATEMVVSAISYRLKIHEVPIHYHTREGRSKLNPLYDGWRHVRFMLLYCPLWLYFIPGMLGFLFGMGSILILLRGPVYFLGHSWDIHFMIFASVTCILSYQILNLGIYAHTYAIREGFLRYDAPILTFKKMFTLEKALLLGGAFFLIGFAINLFIFIEWFSKGFGSLYRLRESILAMTLLIIGLQTMFSSFFISLLFLRRKRKYL